jgi:hypothetical protein
MQIRKIHLCDLRNLRTALRNIRPLSFMLPTTIRRLRR